MVLAGQASNGVGVFDLLPTAVLCPGLRSQTSRPTFADLEEDADAPSL
jgi:hypothetical protein